MIFTRYIIISNIYNHLDLFIPSNFVTHVNFIFGLDIIGYDYFSFMFTYVSLIMNHLKASLILVEGYIVKCVLSGFSKRYIRRTKFM